MSIDPLQSYSRKIVLDEIMPEPECNEGSGGEEASVKTGEEDPKAREELHLPVMRACYSNLTRKPALRGGMDIFKSYRLGGEEGGSVH